MSEHPAEDLLLALAGEPGLPAPEPGALAAARAHLEACSTCAERVRACRAAAQLLTAASPASRAFCPSRAELARAAGELTAERAALRARHLDACPWCRADLADLRALTATPAPAAEAVLEPLRARVALVLAAGARALRLVEATLLPAQAPTLAPARGEGVQERPVVLLAPFGAGSLEVSWVAARGAVDLKACARGAAPASYRLALGPGPGTAAEEAEPGVWESRSADAAGQVTLSGLAPGSYLLAAYGPLRRTPDLEVELTLGLEAEG